jgi:hypothetical protein
VCTTVLRGGAHNYLLPRGEGGTFSLVWGCPEGPALLCSPLPPVGSESEEHLAHFAHRVG